jgi:hypothetical protein
VPELRLYEVVRVVPRPSADPELAALRGCVGVVLGASCEPGEPPVSYAISIDVLGGETWSIEPGDLESMGTFRRREDYYGGGSIRVSGSGSVLED